jgi:hypothetical protein
MFYGIERVPILIKEREKYRCGISHPVNVNPRALLVYFDPHTRIRVYGISLLSVSWKQSIYAYAACGSSKGGIDNAKASQHPKQESYPHIPWMCVVNGRPWRCI